MRLRIRQANGCDCEGDAGSGRHVFKMADNQNAHIKRVTGDSPNTCVYRAFRNPLVAAVLTMYRASSNGMGTHPASILPLDPPHIVWEGLLHYVGVEGRIKAHDREQQEKKKNNQSRQR